MTDFFCPLPWKGIFVHTNKTGVCCVSSKMFHNVSPDDFLNSDYLKDLREKFLRGEIDDTCRFCVSSELNGLQSIRQHAIKIYGRDTTPRLEYIEMRASNLCNFACQMCNRDNSSLISGEVENISEENWQQVLKNTKDLNTVVLTGGEPLLIKRYYELLDYLIEHNKQDDITLRIYTNCSVYNPSFIDKLSAFKKCHLNMSIDGIEHTAEMQRTNTVWKTVDENIRKFCDLPINLKFHSTLTNINILDIDRLIEYFIEIKSIRPDINFAAHSIGRPQHLLISNLDPRLKDIAITKLDRAISMMSDECFDQFRTQLENNRKIIQNL